MSSQQPGQIETGQPHSLIYSFIHPTTVREHAASTRGSAILLLADLTACVPGSRPGNGFGRACLPWPRARSLRPWLLAPSPEKQARELQPTPPLQLPPTRKETVALGCTPQSPLPSHSGKSRVLQLCPLWAVSPATPRFPLPYLTGRARRGEQQTPTQHGSREQCPSSRESAPTLPIGPKRGQGEQGCGLAVRPSQQAAFSAGMGG